MPDFDDLYNPDLSQLPSQVADPELIPINDPFKNYSTEFTPPSGISHVDSALGDLDKSLSGQSWNSMLQPVAYDRTKTNADRYQHSNYFGEMGFNPFSDNEERYGNRQTNWNKLGNAFGGSWQLIKNQFVEQLSSWGDTFSFFGDKKSAFEQADFDEINKQQKDLFNNHPIYETAEQRDGIFNFNTIANTIQQSGYAVGAVAEIAAEEAVLSLLTAATFGGTSEIQAARSLKLASSIGRVLRKTERLGESLNTANKFRKMVEGFKTINPVGNTIEYLSSLKAIRRANEIGYGASKLGTLRTISKGVGALYRDVRVFNAAISEAKAEAAFTYQNLKDTFTERYKNEHGGNEPAGQNLQDIDNAAMGAAQTNGVANTFLIMFSNQLFEGNIMKGFSGLSRMEESASRGILRLGDKTAEKMGVKFVNAAENKWLAFKQGLLRAPLKYVGANFGEALQENLQDITGDTIQKKAIQDFYRAKYHDTEELPPKDTLDFLKAAAADQFTTQGAKTFISGFLTGAVLAPGRYAFGKAGNIHQYLSDKQGYQKRQTEISQQRNNIIEASNQIWKNPLSFGYKQGDVTLQANFGAILQEAAQNKDKHAFYDVKDDALRHFVLTGIRSGSLESFTERLQSYSKNLSPEEFTTAFNIEYNERNAAAIKEQIDGFSQRAAEIQKLHEQATSKLVNPFNPFRFKAEQQVPQNEAYVKEAVAHRAWNDAVDNYVFTNSYYQDTIKGQANILSDLKADGNLRDVNFNDIYLLTSPAHVNTEIGLLQQELLGLKSRPADSSIAAFSSQKQQRLEQLLKYKTHLDKWSEDHMRLSSLPTGDARTKAFEESFEAFRANGTSLFENFINNELKSIDKPLISKDNLSRTFDSMHNYMKLQKESGIILDKVNLLADPVNFFNFYTTHNEQVSAIYDGAISSGKSGKISDAEREEKKNQRKTNGKSYDKQPSWVKKGINGSVYYRLPGDNRVGEDIIHYYGIEDGASGSLKEVLVKAINSSWTHPYLKEAFSKFLPYVKDELVVAFDTKQAIAAGYYTLGTDTITMDPELHEADMSFEGVLLHELIHALTSDELDSGGYFFDAISALYKDTRSYLEQQGVDIAYYGFTNEHEFLAEIYSNPEFQKELAAVPAEGYKSAWEKFIDILSKFIKEKFGLDMQPSVLDNVFFNVEEYLDNTVYNEAVAGLKRHGITQQELDGYSRKEVIDIAAREGLVNLHKSRNSVTVNWKDEKGGKQQHTFFSGQVYAGQLKQVEESGTKEKTEPLSNNDKIKINAISQDGKTISATINGGAAVDFDALAFAKLAKQYKWVDFKSLEPVEQVYHSLRDKTITYRVLQYDANGFPSKAPDGTLLTQEVAGRITLNNTKEGLLFSYGNKTVEFNPANVVNKQDLAGLSVREQQVLKDVQERMRSDFHIQIGILKEAYKEMEAKMTFQQSLAEDNQTAFEKTQRDIADLNARLELLIEKSETVAREGRATASAQIAGFNELKEELSKEIGEKNNYLQRLMAEREAAEQLYDQLKKTSNLYAAASFELEEMGTPFGKGGKETIYDTAQQEANDLQRNQVTGRLSDERIQQLLEEAGSEIAVLRERIAIVEDFVAVTGKLLVRVAKYDDILTAIVDIKDKRQLISYLSTLKKQETDADKKAIISSLVKGINKGDTATETQYVLQKAALFTAARQELKELLGKASGVQDKFDRLSAARAQRTAIAALQERVDFLKQVHTILTEKAAAVREQGEAEEQTVLAKTGDGILELHDFVASMSDQPVITSEESAFLQDNAKPRLDQIGLFKTADRHFLRDSDAAPTSEQAARFFKFSEQVVPNGDHFFQVVTADNDIYGIRTPGLYAGDIKIIAVIKEGDSYRPVGVDGNSLSNVTKDNLVYTSLHGNEKLLGANKADAIAWMKENFTTTGMTEQEIAQKLEAYKAFRAAIQQRIEQKEEVYLPIIGKSNGIVVREPKDVRTNKPQQLPLAGRLLVSDNEDWVNLEHPDGTAVQLEVSTTGAVINKKMKAGRLALTKEDGSVFQVYNRLLSEEEKNNVIAVLKQMAPLIGRRYGNEINRLTEDEQDYLDKAIHYLTGVLYWRQGKEGVAGGKDQFRIAKGMLYRGDLAVSLNADAIEQQKDALLKGIYHQVNNKQLSKPGEAFYELVAVGDTTTEKKWVNYQQYLLDNTGNRSTPVYTNVKPYASDTAIHQNQLRSVYLMYGYHEESVVFTPVAETDEVLESSTSEKEAMRADTYSREDLATLIEQARHTTASDIIDENARLSLSAEVKVKEDIEAFQAWMRQRLPQIPVQPVSHLINGRNWGQFLEGAIHIYENAEEGTGYHEAFEAVWNTYLTTEEQNQLAEEFRQRSGEFNNLFSRATKKYAEASLYDVREMLAEEFRSYILNDGGVVAENAPVRNRVFRKLWNFIKKLLGLSAADNATLNAVIQPLFEKINTGAFVGAKPLSFSTEPSFRALEGNTVHFTHQLMEGMVSVFFSKLYTSQRNIESLFDKKDNSALFNTLYRSTRDAVAQYFNAPINGIVKNLSERSASQEQMESEVARYTNTLEYKEKKSVLDRFNGEVLTAFKEFLGQFGLQFNAVEDPNNAFSEAGEDNKNEIAEKEATATNALGIRESIFIDPRNMTKSTVRLLIASLTADEYKANSTQVQIKKNGLGLPSLADYGRKLNILLNELHSIVPVYEDGKRVDTIDLMFRKLDERFKAKDGKFKPGFEWIQKLKARLKYELNGQKVDFLHLNDDEIRLLVGFEASFSRNKNEPVKLMVGEGGNLFSLDPVVVTNAAKVKERWQNQLKDKVRMLKPDEDRRKAPVVYINEQGRLTFNRNADALARLLEASTNQGKLEGLKKLGISFTTPDAELMTDPEKMKAIADSFNRIRFAFKEGLINGFDDLFGKQVVNGPIAALLTVELDATAEDNILSHRNAEGKQQYAVTLPSAISMVVNSLKGVKNIKDFILTNPQYGSVSDSGEVLLNPYQANSRLLQLDGLLFDKKGNKKRNIDYQYILGMSLLNDSEGENTDSLAYPDKIVQEMYHLLNGTYFTIVNSDKSSEFGLNMGHFISWQDIKKSIESNTYIMQAYKNALIDEVKAAVFEENNPTSIQYYSEGVKALGHFRDILGFIEKEEGKKVFSSLQKEFNKNVLKGTETPERFVSRPQVQALIVKYLNEQVKKHQSFLVDQGLVNEVPLDKGAKLYASNAFSSEQLEELGIPDAQRMSETALTNIVKFLVINRQINVFEQHKLLYGHPALYKDLAKRSNGINSQKDLMTENRQVLNWMDNNMKRLDGKQRDATQESVFRFISYKDPVVISRYHKDIAQGLYDSLIKDLPHAIVEKQIGATFNQDGTVHTVEGGKGTYMEAYLNSNESDGQAYIMMDFFRDMMYLSGKFTKDQAALWEYEKASEIVDRSDPQTNYYKQYSKEEIQQARSILAAGKPKGIILQALKPQGFGYQNTEGVTHTTFLKHAVFPLTWNRVKDNPAMTQLYLNAQQQQVDIIGFESGQKVGNVLKNGSFVALYNEKGEATGEQVPVQEMYTRFYGIQVEMAAQTKDSVVMGTQMRKLILTNLPGELKGVADEYIKVLEELMRLDKQALLREIGLVKKEDGSYQVDNLKGLVNTLRREAIARDLPDNVIDMISAVETEAGARLLYKFDANPIREKIDNILNAIVDSRVIAQKMFGKGAIQVAATLWEKDARNYMYLKDKVWTSALNVDSNSLTEAERKSIRMVSSDLKFYTKEEPWMEIMLPHYFKGILPENVNLKDLDSRLLQAIGFRIPTQGLNSIDHIRIKGFLDPSMGDMVVLPSEIVGKSGGDFDADKLNIFLANYYIERKDFGSQQFTDFLTADLIEHSGYSEKYIRGMVPQLALEDIQKINSATYTERGKIQKDAAESLEGISQSDLEYEVLSSIKAAITRYSGQFPENNPVIKYVDPSGNSKEALQNRLIVLMGKILSHPDNYRQLVMPNSAETLKGLANEIRELKNQDKEGSSLTKLSEWQPMAETRERYISGKKLVGIGALQITAHTISQLAEIELTGHYKNKEGKELPVTIKFDHHSEAGKFYLNAIKDKGNQYVSELLSEALTGFVDAAKDPFIFDLNLNLQTAATWFYLQKMGVPVKELAYFHAQPLIEQFFSESGKNKSYVSRANETELSRDMVVFKAADAYLKKAFDSTKSLYQLGLPDQNGEWKTSKEYFVLKAKYMSEISRYREGRGNYNAADLRTNIQNQHKAGYQLTKQDAMQQLSLLFDYLDYQQQSSYLSNFINAISYDTATTKNIIENQIQDSSLAKAYSDHFITAGSIDNVFNKTFLGELKAQKQDIANMFGEFFVTLHPNAQPAFVKVLELINHPELNMSKDQKVDLLNRYQNFFITALLHTVKFKEGQDEKALNERYGLFFGDHSFAIQLKNLQGNVKYKDNLALKQLFPLINSNRNATDNVKLFNNKLSTYEMNLISESLIHLKQQAEAENDVALKEFVTSLGTFAILQSGVQMSPITYAKVLPIEVYSSIVGTILDRFTQADIDSFNPDLIWKQFHQNNWYNNQIVPRVKRYNREKNGLITVSANYNVSNYDYISVQELKPDLAGEKNPKRLELEKQKKWNEIYDHGLYERIRFQDETGNDITDRQPVRYYRPVNRLGSGMHMTEVYTMVRGSILAENKAFDEAVFDGAVQDIVSSLGKPVHTSPIVRALDRLDCSR